MKSRSRILVSLTVMLTLATGAHALDFKSELGPFNPWEVEEVAPQPNSSEPVLVPVPRVTIYPGQVISEDMIEDRDFAALGDEVPKVFAARDGLIGKVSRQTLLPNVAVAPSSVREPFTVKQGQPAVAVFRSGPLVISAVTMPLESGAVGDAVSLRNSESGSTIRGVVQPDGSVRVGGP